MIQKISEWYHLANARPVGTEAAVCGQNINPFEFVHRDVFFLKQIRVLPQAGVESVPLHHEFVVSLFSVLYQRGVLQPFEILFVPVHQDVWVIWQYLQIWVEKGVFTQ